MQRQSTHNPRLWKCHALVITAKQTIKIEHRATSGLPLFEVQAKLTAPAPPPMEGTFSAIQGGIETHRETPLESKRPRILLRYPWCILMTICLTRETRPQTHGKTLDRQSLTL
jgi:hypothetical protein